MTAKIIGFCRYSVLTDTGQAWQIGKRRGWRAYKAMLLNPERLERRLVLLEKVMLPSVAGQSVPPETDWFQLCLLVSDQLPPDAYEALSNVVSRYNWCRIVPVSTKPAALSKCISESLDEFVDPQSCFASFRLDDDDALGRHYVEQLLSYTHEGHRGHVLTFPGGCKGWFDHGTQAYTRLAGHRESKIALGLAYVGHCQDKIRHVFQLGNHARVDENFPVISLPSSPMYLRSFHDDNDVLSVTETDKRAARVDLIFEKGQPMALNQLDEHFALGQGGHGSQEVFIKQWRLRLYTWFDPHWYLRQYPDVAQAGLDPWHHYQSHGVNEGRLPCMVSAMEWDKALWQKDKPRAQCVAELERLADSDNPLEASFAGFALGRWHAWQGEWARAAACLARRPPGKGVLPNHRGPDLLTVEAFGRSGQLARAWQALATLQELAPEWSDTRLAVANLLAWQSAAYPEAGTDRQGEWQRQRLGWINGGWQRHGLAEVELTDPTAALSLDHLAAHGSPITTHDSPLITVIVPAFKAADTLPTALRSLAAQRGVNLEVIVVDDASPDSTASVAEAFAANDARFRVIHQPYNQGAYAARNQGLVDARGEFITVHDSDDWSHPDKLATQLAGLEAHPEWLACCSHWVRCTPELIFGRWRMEEGWTYRNVSSLMFRREVFEALGYWDRVRVEADTEYYHRIRAAFGNQAIGEVLPGVPLAFGRSVADSLTAVGATHLITQFGGVRADYREASQAWHRAEAGQPERLYLHAEPDERPFTVPEALRP